MDVAMDAALRGVLLPAIVCGLAMLLQRLLPVRLRAGWASLAMALGYFAGHIALSGAASIRPKESINWLPWYGLSAGVVALVAAAFRNHIIIRYIGAVLIAAAAIHFFGKFDADKRVLSIVGFGIGALVAFAGLDVASRSGAKLSSTLALMVLFTVLSGTLVISGSAKQGQLVGASTACVGALFVAALVFRFIRAEAVLPVFAGLALLLGPIMYGQVFSSLPWISAALFAIAAASISVVCIPALRHMRESPQK